MYTFSYAELQFKIFDNKEVELVYDSTKTLKGDLIKTPDDIIGALNALGERRWDIANVTVLSTGHSHVRKYYTLKKSTSISS